MQHQAGGSRFRLIFEAGRRARYAYHGACPAREMETAIPLEEALAMAAAYEEPVYGYAFAGGSAAGHQLEKTEYKACIFTNCRFTGAALSGAWFQNAVFENCDLSGAKLLEATLQKVRLRGCKLSG